MLKTEMSSLWQVMSKLRERGFRLDFTMSDDGRLLCSSTNQKFGPEEVCIDRVYRFEGESDPGDMSVMYAMETQSGAKGLYVDAYGPASGDDSPSFAAFIKKVQIKRDRLKHDMMLPIGERVKNFFKKLLT
jgi:hypothetical protein